MSSAGELVAIVRFDGLAETNHAYGFQAGDVLLRAVGDALASVLGAEVVGRYGASTFVVASSADSRGCRGWGRMLREAVADVPWRGGRLDCWIGLSFLRATPGAPAQALAAAEVALESARACAAGTIHEVSPDDSRVASAAATSAELGELRRAVQAGRILLTFAPVVALADRRRAASLAVSVAALGTDGASIHPAGCARLGLASRIDRLVVDHAIESFDSLASATELQIGVSASTIGDAFARFLLGLAAARGVAPWRIALEVAGTLDGSAASRAAGAVALLRRSGAKVFLSELGDAASFACLRAWEIDGLKLSRDLVAGLGRGLVSKAAVVAVVGLGRHMGLTVDAAGVEAESQASWLATAGVARGDGPLFGSPRPLGALDGVYRLPR